ncbi:MAG: cupredoxin domain-containing protein [Dehalococcoidia bacterium]
MTRPLGEASAWVRLIAGAFLVSAVVFVMVMVINRALIPPLLIQALIAAPLAYAVLRWHGRRWVLVLSAVAALLALVGGAPFYMEDLQHPESGWAFVPSAFLVVAFVVALLAGIAASLRRSEAPARAITLGAGGLAALLLVVGLVATLGVSDDAQAEGDTLVVAKQFEFPETVAVQSGDVGLYIQNKDLVRHTFVIEDAGVKVELPGSTSRHVSVALQAGTYEFHCDVPGHESMKGTLEVN